MLDSIAAAEVLRGVRGGKGVDRAALADIIIKVSQLVNDLPEIQEVDLNPIFVRRAHAPLMCVSSSATPRKTGGATVKAISALCSAL